MGPRARVLAYFNELGYTFSPGNNPADELLDFVAGRAFAGDENADLDQTGVTAESYDGIDYSARGIGGADSANGGQNGGPGVFGGHLRVPSWLGGPQRVPSGFLSPAGKAVRASARQSSAMGSQSLRGGHRLVDASDQESGTASLLHGQAEVSSTAVSTTTRAQKSAAVSAIPFVEGEFSAASAFFAREWLSRQAEYNPDSVSATGMHTSVPGSESVLGGSSSMLSSLSDRLRGVQLNGVLGVIKPQGSLNNAASNAAMASSQANQYSARDGSALENVDPDSICARRGATFLYQLYLCHNRSVLQQYRQVTTFGLEMGVCVLAGGMMGAAALQFNELYQSIILMPYTPISPSPLDIILPSIGFYIALAVGIAGSPAGVLAFGEEKAVFYREAAAGHSRTAYYIAKSVSVIYRFTLGTIDEYSHSAQRKQLGLLCVA
jgi:hypothetical protein